MQAALPEDAPGMQLLLALLKVGQQAGLFFGEGTKNGGGHAGNKPDKKTLALLQSARVPSLRAWRVPLC